MAAPSVNECLARFLEAPNRETFRDLLRDHFGETNNLDFKALWPVFPKVAKHLLAFANSGGGVLVIGVDEKGDGQFTAVGLNELADKAKIDDAVRRYLPPGLGYDVLDVTYSASEYEALVGKKFQIVIVEHLPARLPFVCNHGGSELREGAIYVRRGTQSREANHEEVQAIISQRLATQRSKLGKGEGFAKHLEQLELLHEHRSRHSGLLVPLLKDSGYRYWLNSAIRKKEAVLEQLLELPF